MAHDRYLAERVYGPTRTGWVLPLLFGRARLIVGHPARDWFEDGW